MEPNNAAQLPGWILDFTLSRGNPFHWQINAEHQLVIRRVFNNGNMDINSFTQPELEQIFDFVPEDHETPLDNNVQTVPEANPNEPGRGLGHFICHRLHTQNRIQLASHLFAIFCHCGIWQHNGAVHNMTVHRNAGVALDNLNAFFQANQQPAE